MARVKFENEFERLLTKAARKHCDKIYPIGSWIGYWQFYYHGEWVIGLMDLYDAFVSDKKIEPFPDSVINEYLGIGG